MKIAIGCDHNGLALKRKVMDLLQEQGHSYYDFGCYDSSSVDYPDIAREVAQAVAGSAFDQGVLICGTGIGMSITANKVKGIRAALCHEPFSAQKAREHNDANVLCMGGHIIGVALARDTAHAFLNSQFLGERHAKRVGKINSMDRSRNGQDALRSDGHPPN